MNNIFIIKLLLSFLVGGLWIVFATVAADRFGSKIGGFIGGLPSTIIFGLFFLAWTQTTEIAVQATTIIPIVGGINCLFLAGYMYFVSRNVWKAVILPLFLWFTLVTSLIVIHFNNYLVSILLYGLLLLGSFVFVEGFVKIKSNKNKKLIYSSSLILIRGLIGGSVVALSVYLGKIGGPVFGGTFSMFPAMFISLMLITYFTHGPHFSSSVMRNSMITSISIIIHSMAVRYTYVPLGHIWGTFLSIFISFSTGFLIYKFLITKLK